MFPFLFYALIAIYALRTLSYAFYCFKNQKKGTLSLVLLALLLIASPFISRAITALQ